MRLAAFALMTGMLLAQTPAAQEEAHFGTTVVASSGFRGDIYFIRHWTNRLPKLENKKAVGSIYTTALNVPPQAFSNGFPGVTKRTEWFAIDYAARFWVQQAGEYRFSLLADDGADLFIDDRLVIDNDGSHPPVEKSGIVQLGPGIHQMRVPYFQGPRWMVALVLKVCPPGARAFQVFDTESFKPPADWDGSLLQTPDK